MKKISTSLLFVFISLSTFAQNGQIMNGAFENWTTSVIFDTLNKWKSSNSEEFHGTPLTLKSTDAQHLTSSVRLENEIINGDSLFGYVYLGAVTQSGTFKGIPYGSPFDMVTGFWKGTMQTGDSAYVICQKFFMGTPYPPLLVPIGGSTSSWTAFAFPITPGPCDSVFIGFTCSNPFDNSNFNPASFIQFDNIAFTNAGPVPAALPNQSFETWGAVSALEADDWNSLNSILATYGLYSASWTTDCYAGSKAALLRTLFVPQFNDTIPGILTNGTIANLSSPNPFIPIAYNASPLNFSGYYKWTPVGIDGAQVSIEFFQAGASIGGYAIGITTNTPNYTLMGGPVNLTGTPDSMLIVAVSGMNPNTQLILDELMLSGGNVGIQEMARKLGFKVFPNPSEGMLYLEWNSDFDGDLQMEITDVAGKLICTRTLFTTAGKNSCTLDMTHVSSGAYYYRVSGSDVNLTGKIILE